MTSFARECCGPSNVALIKVSIDGELNPTLACYTQDTVLHASSTTALDLDSSPRYCIYVQQGKVVECGRGL